MDKQIRVIHFSPTGGTAKVVREIAAGIGDIAEEIDLTLPVARRGRRKRTFGPDDLVIVGVPVYAGRVPKFLVKHFARYVGDDTPAVFVAVYGNRDYEDALVELQDTFEQNGFIGIAAGAFIAEHSYTPLVATGRPDAEDCLAALSFGLEINARLNHPDDDFNAPALAVKGNRPYVVKDPFPLTAPETSDNCRQCGACVLVCPMGAIDARDARLADAALCIRCHACVRTCPVGAKRYDHPLVAPFRDRLIANCRDRRCEPETFF